MTGRAYAVALFTALLALARCIFAMATIPLNVSSTDAEVLAYCATLMAQGLAQGTTSNYLQCCFYVTRELLGGAIQLSSSCAACGKVGVCPEAHKGWGDISKDPNLAICRANGKVDKMDNGMQVVWCLHDSFGVVALVIVLPIVVFFAGVAVSCYYCRACPWAKRRLGLNNQAQQVGGMMQMYPNMKPQGYFPMQ